MPKITSPVALKTYRALARPYDALATTFISGKWERLRDEVEIGDTIWRNVSPKLYFSHFGSEELTSFKDNNNGLVQQVLLTFRKKAVRNLGNTFAAVTTANVSQRALSNSMNVQETERYIVALTAQEGFSTSLIHLSKDPNTSMLRFLTGQSSEPSIELEVSLEEQLRSQHEKLELLIQNIQNSDRKLEFTKEYISHLRKAQKRNDAASRDAAIGFGGGGRKREQNVDIDEDMMDELQ